MSDQSSMSFLLQLGVPVLASIGSAFLAVHLALRRFYREKWWERKLSAYITALEALHLIRYVYAEWEDVELLRRELPSALADELRAKRRSAEVELRKAVDIGEFLISSAGAEELRRFLRGMYEARHGDDPIGAYGEVCTLADATLAKLKSLAQADLQLSAPRPWWRPTSMLVRRPGRAAR